MLSKLQNTIVLKITACIVSFSSLLFVGMLSFWWYHHAGREGIIATAYILLFSGLPCTLLAVLIQFQCLDGLIGPFIEILILFLIPYNLIALITWKHGKKSQQRLTGSRISMKHGLLLFGCICLFPLATIWYGVVWFMVWLGGVLIVKIKDKKI